MRRVDAPCGPSRDCEAPELPSPAAGASVPGSNRLTTGHSERRHTCPWLVSATGLLGPRRPYIYSGAAHLLIPWFPFVHHLPASAFRFLGFRFRSSRRRASVPFRFQDQVSPSSSSLAYSTPFFWIVCPGRFLSVHPLQFAFFAHFITNLNIKRYAFDHPPHCCSLPRLRAFYGHGPHALVRAGR